MDLVPIYQCFSDRTRLRILHLLLEGPLCVCHFQSVLEEPQVKISKHLGYLRTRGVVEATRRGHWMIYALPDVPAPILAANLACLRVCVDHDPQFGRDRQRRQELAPSPEACGCGDD